MKDLERVVRIERAGDVADLFRVTVDEENDPSNIVLCSRNVQSPSRVAEIHLHVYQQ
jgi:hypothetical protein